MAITILRKVSVSGGTVLRAANNLGDVGSAATSRTNLGLGSGDSVTHASLTLTGALGTSGGASLDIGATAPTLQIRNAATDAPYVGFYRGGTIRSALQLYTDNDFRFLASDLTTPAAISAGAGTFAGVVTTSSATRSGAGAIPITTSLVKFTSTGAGNALTLADGSDGQRLTIVHDVKGSSGTGVITPTTKTGFTTITLNNAGDTVSLVFVTTRGWMVTGYYLAVIA